MKKQTLFMCCLFLIGLAEILAGAESSIQQKTEKKKRGEKNLIVNPGFEKWQGNNPAGWNFMNCSGTKKAFITKSSTESHQGKYSAEIVSDNGGVSGYWTQIIKGKLKPGKKYRVGVYVKATSGMILLWVVGINDAGADKSIAGKRVMDKRAYRKISPNKSVLEDFIPNKYLTDFPPNQWTEMSITFTVPNNIHGIRISMGSYFQEGMMWFDDVSLTEEKK